MSVKQRHQWRTYVRTPSTERTKRTQRTIRPLRPAKALVPTNTRLLVVPGI